MFKFVLRYDCPALEIFDWLQEQWPLGDVPEGPSYLFDTRWKVAGLCRRDELIWHLEENAWARVSLEISLTEEDQLVMFKLKYSQMIEYEY
jgi:hypothetical protein